MSVKEAIERERQQFEHSSAALLGGENPRLLSALRAVCPGLRNAFVVHWIPEQGEDIHTVVVSDDHASLIIIVELSKVDEMAEPELEVFSVREYNAAHPHLSRGRRRTLELALELSRRLSRQCPSSTAG